MAVENGPQPELKNLPISSSLAMSFLVSYKKQARGKCISISLVNV